MDLIDRIDALSDDHALWALDFVGRVFAADHGKAPTVLARQIRAICIDEQIPLPQVEGGKVVGGPAAAARAGTIARHALKSGLGDPRAEIRRTVETAVTEITEPQVAQELVTIVLIGGAILLGLAALAIMKEPGLKPFDSALCVTAPQKEILGRLRQAALSG